MQARHKYLSNLTPLRGIAAIWVVIFHFQILLIQFVPVEHTSIVAKGYIFVDLFFIMSGFIMSHVYQQNFQKGFKDQNISNFFIARFARIYPLHFFTLACLIIYPLLTGKWGMVFNQRAIPAHILLIHSFGYSKLLTWNSPSWSISAEWWAYVAFPFLVAFIYSKKTLALATLGLFVVCAYLAIIFWIPRYDNTSNTIALYPHDLNVTYDYGFIRGLAGFILGMLVYKFYEADMWSNFFRKDFSAFLLIIACVVCLHLGINDGFYIILFIGLVYAFSLNNGKLHAICNSWLLQYLGKISYSIYLTSMLIFLPLLHWVKFPGVTYIDGLGTAGFLTGFGYCFAILSINIALASVTYYAIEKTCRKYIKAKWAKTTAVSVN